MIFIIWSNRRIDFVYFLIRLSFIQFRRRFPYIRVFKWILQVWIILFISDCTEASIGRPEVSVGFPIDIIVIDWVVIEREWLILSIYNWTVINMHARQHCFDILYCIFLSYDVVLEFSPIFYVFTRHIVQNYFLFYGVY